MLSTGSPEEQRPTLAKIWNSLREVPFLRGLVRALVGYVKVVGAIVVGIFFLAMAMMVGNALFGNYFEAGEAVLKDTAIAQGDITRALSYIFDNPGRLDVRNDYSVYAYIPKKNFMLVPFPDRDRAIAIVGKSWCENRRVIGSKHTLPKVEVRDIHTGEVLGSYRCFAK